jgi:hypothetical protein
LEYIMLSHFKAIAVACIVAFTGVSHAAGTWETTLLGRDITGKAVDGSSASAVFLYDTDLNITWLRDTGRTPYISWEAAMTWASTLTVGGYGGWRLPAMIDTGAPGCQFFSFGGTDCGYNVDPATGEMAHLFQVELANVSQFDTSGNPRGGSEGVGWGLVNSGDFQNLQSDDYWYGQSYPSGGPFGWRYSTSNMSQYPSSSITFALTVRPGDVLAAVPEPETYAMILAGICMLGAVVRRRKLTG